MNTTQAPQFYTPQIQTHMQILTPEITRIYQQQQTYLLLYQDPIPSRAPKFALDMALEDAIAPDP